MDIEGCVEGAACPNDYFRIHDGESLNAPIMYTHYGQQVKDIHTTSNHAYLTFVSDMVVQYGGFKATITEATPGK